MIGVLYFLDEDLFLSKLRLLTKSTVQKSVIDGQEVARIERKFGTVKRKLNNEISYLEVNEADKLFNEDTVFTEKKSEANIILSDGGNIKLGPESLVVISIQQDDPFVNLKKGKIFGQIKKGKILRVKSAGTIKEMEGDDTKITLDTSDKGTTKITILDGQLKIKSGGASKVIQKNQVVNFDNKGQISKIEPLVIELVYPRYSTLVWSENVLDNVNFQWRSDQAVENYNLIVAKDNSFSDTLFNNIIQSTSQNIDALPVNETLYWKVEGMKGGKKFSSPTFIFRRLINEAPVLIIPENYSTLPLDKSNKVNVALGWKLSYKYAGFELQVAKDIQFTQLAFKGPVKGTKKEIKNLPAGEYYWRVRMLRKGGNEAPWSSVHSFRIQQDQQNIQESIPFDLEEEALFDNQKLIGYSFKWNVQNNEKQFKFLLSSDEEFSNIIKEKNVDKKLYKLSIKKNGEYWWKVAPMNNGKVGRYSQSKQFVIDVPEMSPIEVIPMDKDIYNIKDQILFKWIPTGSISGYQIDIAKTELFDEIDISQDILSPEIEEYELQGKEIGDYYWRIRGVGEDGTSKGPYSETVSFQILKSLETPEFFNNQEATVVNRRLLLKWKKLDSIENYQLLVSLSRDGAKNLIRTTTSNSYNIRFRNKGTQYLWIKAISSSGQEQINKRLLKLDVIDPIIAPKISSKRYNPSKLRWQRINGVQGYEVQILKRRADGKNIIFKRTVNGTSFQLGRLSKGLYYWRVRGFYKNVKGPYSKHRGFRVRYDLSNGLCDKKIKYRVVKDVELRNISVDLKTNCLIINK